MTKLSYVVTIVLFCVASTTHAGWSEFDEITTNYFQPIGTTDQSIIVTLKDAFHDCGWDTAVQITESTVGENYFKTITSVILSAIMANKRISVLTTISTENQGTTTSYCNGSKINVLGIRVEH